MTRKWYFQPQVVVAAGVFVLALCIYVTTQGPTTAFWDCGEFITTSHIVGVPHQPGTPLYVLVGRVFDVLLGNPDITQPAMRTAWAVNFMSGFFSSLAVMLIYLIIWELARRADPDSGWLAHVGGVVGACFLAFSETFWNNATEAEVYGLAGFMLALLTWLAIRWYDHRAVSGSNQLLLLMIYLLGLGVGFHLGTLLVYPGIFLMVLLSRQRHLEVRDLLLMSVGLALFLFSTTTRNNTVVVFLLAIYLAVVLLRTSRGERFALLGSALFFVGLTVHVMMMIRAGASPEPVINQTDPDNFGTLLSVIRREQYPPLNPLHRQAPLSFQFGYYYNFLFKQFYFLGPGHGVLTMVSTVLGPIFLALVGLFHGLRRVRPLILVPLANYLFNGEILTLYLNFTDHEVRDRDYFYFAAFMFCAVFIGLGAAALLRYAAGKEGASAVQMESAGEDWRRVSSRIGRGPVIVAGAVILLGISLLPITPGHTKYFEHDRSENRIAYEYAWNILAGLDENAILFTNGDNDTFPIWYLQTVEHFRTDVSVVNLSLVNLPWYVKQIKYCDNPVAMHRSDEEIDGLQHRLYENPETGERTILMIKDYVLHDIMTTNYEEASRPVFFAVTIPQENMVRYFPMLQMEGMAYRLLDEPGKDNLPVTDAQRVMRNMLGVYDMGSLMSGDTPARQALAVSLAARASDRAATGLEEARGGLTATECDSLAELLGRPRTDIFRNTNARHLLGNYPAALNRAGYQSYVQATEVAMQDTAAYNEHLQKALIAFGASLAVAPFNEQALDFYPLLLVQAYRDRDAKEFLDTLAGNVPVELEERVVYNALRGFIRGGVKDLALGWAAERVADNPDRRFYYQLQFSLYQMLGRTQEMSQTMAAWEDRFGEPDPDMVRVMEQTRREAMQREQDRIRDAVENGNDQ